MTCSPSCPGFGVFNVPQHSADDVTGGEIQRCDECGIFRTDAEVYRIFDAFGCNVRMGVITYVPTRAYPALCLLGCAPEQPRPVRLPHSAPNNRPNAT